MNLLLRCLSALVLLTVAACGGGGGGGAGTPVLGTGSGTATAEDLSLTLSAPSMTNGGSATVVATATAVDKNRNVVAGIPVTFTVDSGATAAPSAKTTNAQGIVTAAIGNGSDRSNRVITVTATSGTLVRTASFAVTGARLTVSASPLVVAGSAGNIIEYTLVDFNAVAMFDQTITVSGTGLPSVSGKTDLNGKFRYTYTAPAAPGTVDVVASAAGDERKTAVTVSAAASGVAPAPEVPQSASLAATPSVVTVNTSGSSTNQVELRALFVGASNKPIPRVRVRFDLAGNGTNTDGTVSWVGAYAYSDDNGVARATFVPGQRSSPTNGVTVRACYDVGDFGSGPGGACDGVSRSTTTTLTVSSEALAVTIGTNNLIKSGRNNLTYIKEYVVMVTDAAGAAKPDAQITPSVDLLGSYKGVWRWVTDKWVQFGSLGDSERYFWNGSGWARTAGADVICPNEDVNRNGVREAPTFGVDVGDLIVSRQEDLNWNGALDPRKSDVAVTMVGGTKTDTNGLAILQIEYPQSHGSWVKYAITISASGVSGTESRTQYAGVLPVLASALTDENVPPPFATSPYGVSSSCLNAN